MLLYLLYPAVLLLSLLCLFCLHAEILILLQLLQTLLWKEACQKKSGQNLLYFCCDSSKLIGTDIYIYFLSRHNSYCSSCQLSCNLFLRTCCLAPVQNRKKEKEKKKNALATVLQGIFTASICSVLQISGDPWKGFSFFLESLSDVFILKVFFVSIQIKDYVCAKNWMQLSTFWDTW